MHRGAHERDGIPKPHQYSPHRSRTPPSDPVAPIAGTASAELADLTAGETRLLCGRIGGMALSESPRQAPCEPSTASIWLRPTIRRTSPATHGLAERRTLNLRQPGFFSVGRLSHRSRVR